MIFLPLAFLIFLSSCLPSVKCCWPTALTAVLLAVYFVPLQLNVRFFNITTFDFLVLISTIILSEVLTITCGKLQLIGYAVRTLRRCRENKCFIKKEKCLFRSFLMQIKTMDDVIEERNRKIENEELLRIFPINVVTQKLTEENKDRKRFSFQYK